MSSSSDKPKPISKQEVRAAAIAWVEFLYDEYILQKHKQLLLATDAKTIKLKQRGGKGKQ